MRRFRRRRARPLWFPPLGTSFTIGDDTTTTGAVTFQVGVNNSGAIGFIEFPLTFDVGQERTQAFASPIVPTNSLSDLMSSAWRCRRIVGDVFATYVPGGAGPNDPSGVAPPAVLFTAGFMVRNVNEAGLPPAGNVDALNADDYDDPWIWRRSWILGQNTNTTRFGVIAAGQSRTNLPFSGTALTDPQYAFSQFPNTNVQYGYKDGGSRVDQKTNRIIGVDQRLFIHFATKALPIQPQGYNGAPESNVVGVFDLRLLGYIARASNRRNAAR